MKIVNIASGPIHLPVFIPVGSKSICSSNEHLKTQGRFEDRITINGGRNC